MFFVLIFLPKAISFHIWRLKRICIFLLFTKSMGQSCAIFLDFIDSPSQTYMKLAFINFLNSKVRLYSVRVSHNCWFQESTLLKRETLQSKTPSGNMLTGIENSFYEAKIFSSGIDLMFSFIKLIVKQSSISKLHNALYNHHKKPDTVIMILFFGWKSNDLVFW